MTDAQVAEAARFGAAGPNRLKAWLRRGMGRARAGCAAPPWQTIAAARGTTAAPGVVGHSRLRAPVRPVTLAQAA